MLQTKEQAQKHKRLGGSTNKIAKIYKTEKGAEKQKHFFFLIYCTREGSMLLSLAQSQRGELCVVQTTRLPAEVVCQVQELSLPVTPAAT